MIRLCFVCLGNICRSPTAEGVMLSLIEKAALGDSIEVDSAGTSGYHQGEPADGRARQVAQSRGFSLPSISRKLRKSDLTTFDYVLAMDQDNYDNILELADSEEERSKVHLFRKFDPQSPPGAEVPDPYYGGPQGFEEVFDICMRASEGLLEALKKQL